MYKPSLLRQGAYRAFHLPLSGRLSNTSPPRQVVEANSLCISQQPGRRCFALCSRVIGERKHPGLALVDSLPFERSQLPTDRRGTLAVRSVSSMAESLTPDQLSKLRQSQDKTSFADPSTVRCQSIHFNLNVDFDAKVLSGYVDLTVQRTADGDAPLRLDTRSLTIDSIVDKSSGGALSFKLDEPGCLGTSCLQVTLPASSHVRESTCTVRIHYTTSSEATALQWLDASQTADKQSPYLFTQCQAIHASSMFPCQDTPSVKCPYTAKITVPAGMTCLMSASVPSGEEEACDSDSSKTQFLFEQTTPIPSYLTAMAVGKICSRRIGPRSFVWAEESVVDKAAYEFVETEEMLQAAEGIVGPYLWGGRYDLLLLPPSFPYGGMENPCLTFVTPTLLAGDRSLSSVVAHEISHSWTGNLVTNRTWEHFWLNEGFTTFLERKIVGRLYGEARRHFAFIGGWKALQDSVDRLGHNSPLTALIPPLDGVDPDDAFSSVPYEKGSSFLFYLETLVGGPSEFEPFLLAYVKKYQGVTLTSGDFFDFFMSFFAEKASQDVFEEVDWKSWFFAPGMPPVKPEYDTSMVAAVSSLAQKIEKLTSDSTPIDSTLTADDISTFSSGQVVELLDQLHNQTPQSAEVLARLDAVFKFSDPERNTEQHFRWLRLGLRAGVTSCLDAAMVFVAKQGRMKFVRPLYRDMFANPEWLAKAYSHFEENASFYHPIARTMIQRDHQVAASRT